MPDNILRSHKLGCNIIEERYYVFSTKNDVFYNLYEKDDPDIILLLSRDEITRMYHWVMQTVGK